MCDGLALRRERACQHSRSIPFQKQTICIVEESRSPPFHVSTNGADHDEGKDFPYTSPGTAQ
jgi:hypothetical protein